MADIPGIKKIDTLTVATPFVPTVSPAVEPMDTPFPGYSRNPIAVRCVGWFRSDTAHVTLRFCFRTGDLPAPHSWFLGPVGSNLTQHSPTTRPSVERTAEKAFCFRIAFSSPMQRLVQRRYSVVLFLGVLSFNWSFFWSF